MAMAALPSISTGSMSTGLAADARSLDKLKLVAGSNDPQALREAARQFESLFMRELIKKHARGHHEVGPDRQRR